MRAIQVSTETFAAIWAARQPGEETEDAVLRRVLIGGAAPSDALVAPAIGHRDPRYGVEFAEGFEVFRTYLGQEYRATATGGSWKLAGAGTLHPTLNELSGEIGARTENAWINWSFTDDKGERQLVDTLRDRSKIIRRRKIAR